MKLREWILYTILVACLSGLILACVLLVNNLFELIVQDDEVWADKVVKCFDVTHDMDFCLTQFRK